MQMVSGVCIKCFFFLKDLPEASLIFTEAEIASDVKICSFHRGTLFSGVCTATDGLLEDKKISFQK